MPMAAGLVGTWCALDINMPSGIQAGMRRAGDKVMPERAAEPGSRGMILF